MVATCDISSTVHSHATRSNSLAESQSTAHGLSSCTVMSTCNPVSANMHARTVLSVKEAKMVSQPLQVPTVIRRARAGIRCVLHRWRESRIWDEARCVGGLMRGPCTGEREDDILWVGEGMGTGQGPGEVGMGPGVNAMWMGGECAGDEGLGVLRGEGP